MSKAELLGRDKGAWGRWGVGGFAQKYSSLLSPSCPRFESGLSLISNRSLSTISTIWYRAIECFKSKEQKTKQLIQH